MSLVLKYLRSSSLQVILVVLLLVVKVICDLTLPQYTSSIVNVGIQQGGIESPVPIAMRFETMDALLAVNDEEGAAILLESYHPDTTTYAVPAYVLVGDAMAVEPVITASFGRLGMEAGDQELPESIIRQAAIAAVRSEYEALGIDTADMQMGFIGNTGLKMIGISALSAIASILVSFLAARVAALLGKRLRSDIFTHVVSFSQAEMDKFSTASLVTRSTNDVQQIQQSLVMILRVVILAPLMAMGGLFRVLQTNASMTWTIGVAILAISTVVITLFLLVMPRFKQLQTYVDRVNQVVRETLNGIPVIRAFTTQAHERKRFDNANRDLTRTSLFVNRVMSAMMPLMMLIMNLTTILIVWKGGQNIDAGGMQVGDMMAFIQYAMQIIMSFLMISMLTIMLPRAAVSAGRLKEILDTPITIASPPDPVGFDGSVRGKVEFKQVGFAYPGAQHEVIEDISFTAEPGTMTAIIGSTGSGKSTIINLIPRFHDVSRGQVLIDGVDVRQTDPAELRKRIGYVPQRGMLLSGTIATNIAYGDPSLDKQEIARAASIAQANTFIAEKPDGYDSAIAQGGVNVSGGQRQRISIARAIAMKPEILLLDDSFSALDYRTENSLRTRLREELAGTTVIVVTQRISGILRADRILVIDEGKLVGSGTHRELMETCSVYQQIAQSQLSKQEIERNE